MNCGGDALAAQVASIYLKVLSNVPFSTLDITPSRQQLTDMLAKPPAAPIFGLNCVGLAVVLEYDLNAARIVGSYPITAAKEIHPALALAWQHGTRGACGLLLMDVGAHFPLPLLLKRNQEGHLIGSYCAEAYVSGRFVWTPEGSALLVTRSSPPKVVPRDFDGNAPAARAALSGPELSDTSEFYYFLKPSEWSTFEAPTDLGDGRFLLYNEDGVRELSLDITGDGYKLIINGNAHQGKLADWPNSDKITELLMPLESRLNGLRWPLTPSTLAKHFEATVSRLRLFCKPFNKS